MDAYLAHSAREGFPEQSYREHILNVSERAAENARAAARYAVLDGALLEQAVRSASLVHDLGKLLPDNQKVLHIPDNKAHLPTPHEDAGVAYLKNCMGASFSAQLLVSSHHSGLPDLVREAVEKENDCFRHKSPQVRKQNDRALEELTLLQQEILPNGLPVPEEAEVQGDCSVFCRMALSCLADADHSDTACHYGKYPEEQAEPALLPEKRLQALNAYVQSLGGGNERSRLRKEMYEACRDTESGRDQTSGISIVSCDSPVGSGKTTALMAHILQKAVKRGARRIFVVLPFTNIIRQSVDVYRNALVLPGEDPERVVAELHHRADFQTVEARALTSQWRAPIIVTTAVAFFETLASNRPSALRRLHELPGSMIFVDEAHAALPVRLLPLAWHWMETMADEWQCYWVLASGSLVEFWNLDADGWEKEQRAVPPILPAELRTRLKRYEVSRIQYRYEPVPLSRMSLAEKVLSSPGPRLLIMNTVQSAAVMADDLRERCEDKNAVMHLSTALTAEDREATIEAVKDRLKNHPEDTNWVLVATSCVEAGVDFSFRTGFREISSLLSLLQAAGRINRGGERDDAVIWSFTMQDDPLLTKNPGVKRSASILNRYFQKNVTITPELSTESIQKELNQSAEDLKELLNAENGGKFPDVEKDFRVIGDETVLVVADEALKDKIRFGYASWQDIQRKAVSVRKERVSKLRLKRLAEGEEIYDWNVGYDKFLGIMSGVLICKKVESEFACL
ncbi:MAG: CRISPR-associated endonuclease Cas3'' [bacterium]